TRTTSTRTTPAGRRTIRKMPLGWLCTCSSRWITDDLNIPQRVRSVIPHRRRACYGHRRADSGPAQTSSHDHECLAYHPDVASHDLVAGPAPSGGDLDLGRVLSVARLPAQCRIGVLLFRGNLHDRWIRRHGADEAVADARTGRELDGRPHVRLVHRILLRSRQPHPSVAARESHWRIQHGINRQIARDCLALTAVGPVTHDFPIREIVVTEVFSPLRISVTHLMALRYF